jgi:type II secretory pathway pseudopilin PulG
MIASRAAPRDQRGFAFAETLIAVAIIAAMLGVAFQVMTATNRASVSAQDRRLAVLLAQSLLDQVGTSIAVQPGDLGGRTDGFDWAVAIVPWRERDAASTGAPLFQVTVTVAPSQRSAGRVTLASLRFAS